MTDMKEIVDAIGRLMGPYKLTGDKITDAMRREGREEAFKNWVGSIEMARQKFYADLLLATRDMAAASKLIEDYDNIVLYSLNRRYLAFALIAERTEKKT